MLNYENVYSKCVATVLEKRVDYSKLSLLAEQNAFLVRILSVAGGEQRDTDQKKINGSRIRIADDE